MILIDEPNDELRNNLISSDNDNLLALQLSD